MTGTHAYLPAKHIVEACTGTVKWIQGCKERLKKDLIEAERKGMWLRRSDGHIWRFMPDEKKEIVAQHLTHELLRCRSLLKICKAAMADVPEMRIYVSLDDYEVIAAFYGNG